MKSIIFIFTMIAYISNVSSLCDKDCNNCDLNGITCKICNSGYGVYGGQYYLLDSINCKLDNCNICYAKTNSTNSTYSYIPNTCNKCNDYYLLNDITGKCERF